MAQQTGRKLTRPLRKIPRILGVRNGNPPLFGHHCLEGRKRLPFLWLQGPSVPISSCPQGVASPLASPLDKEVPRAHSQLLPCGLWVQLRGCVCDERVCPHHCHVLA